MKNPEVTHERTPNGGDFSEFWYLTKDNTPARNMTEAVRFKINEIKSNGDIVQTTYGKLERKKI